MEKDSRNIYERKINNVIRMKKELKLLYKLQKLREQECLELEKRIQEAEGSIPRVCQGPKHDDLDFKSYFNTLQDIKEFSEEQKKSMISESGLEELFNDETGIPSMDNLVYLIFGTKWGKMLNSIKPQIKQ